MGLYSRDVLADYKRRIQFSIYIVIFIIFVLIMRLFYLQILKGKKFLEFSEKNRISIQKVKALRGKILDRNGQIIADNRPSFDLALIRGYSNETPVEVIEKIQDFLNWDMGEENLQGVIKKVKSTNRYDPAVIKKDITRDELARSIVREYWLHGLRILEQPVREYPYGDLLAHALGYMGEIGKRTLASVREKGQNTYGLGDYIGMSGVEKLKESDLKGNNGAIPFVEDARGRDLGEEASMALLPEFRKKDPTPGNNLYLTIDLRLQKIVEEAFDKKAGGVIVMDPQTGDVLAHLSRPSFEPRLFTRGVPQEYWAQLMSDKRKPLYDRALRGHYPPGSTFKIITAIAALAEGVIDPDFSYYCKGYYRLGRERKRCWKRSGHGLLKLKEAIIHSCDVYFYELGNRLGIDTIAKYARMFGLGEKTGIGINHEDDGLVPDSQWKERMFNVPWVGGETLSVAVGQGFLTVTPIQMAVMLSALVNGGRVLKANIVKRVENYKGEVLMETAVKERKRVDIKKDIMDIVKEALFGVVNVKGGTGYWMVRSNKVQIAGKTGTAQVIRLESAKKDVEEHGDHAWFIAFAPYEKPKIVVSVLVEHGGHGSSAAGPIAKRIIEGYFSEEEKAEKSKEDSNAI